MNAVSGTNQKEMPSTPKVIVDIEALDPHGLLDELHRRSAQLEAGHKAAR
jgi:hypothetical protein